MPVSRLDGTSGDAPVQPGRQPDGFHKTANQLLVKSYLAVERALDAAAAALAARRPHNGSPDGGPDSNGEGERSATFGDVIACYRLLLGRQPDADGLAHYRRRLAGRPLTLDELVSEFLGSVEFVRRQAERPAGEGLTGETVHACEGFQIRVDPADYAVGHTVARTGSYEPEVSSTLRQVLRPGGTFVDIGANIGWFSLLAASLVGPTGRVIAIEPNPRNVALTEAERQRQ